MFVTLIDSAVRRGELLGLRWCHVQLANPDGPTITIEETWVRNADDSPKSDASKRSIPLSNYCAEELTQHLERTRFGADEDRVSAILGAARRSMFTSTRRCSGRRSSGRTSRSGSASARFTISVIRP
jgi:integrase